MDWRTRNEPIAPEHDASRSFDSLGSLAGVALISLARTGHGRCELGAALTGDLQMARATRGRFGAVARDGVTE